MVSLPIGTACLLGVLDWHKSSFPVSARAACHCVFFPNREWKGFLRALWRLLHCFSAPGKSCLYHFWPHLPHWRHSRCNHSLPFCPILASVLPFPSCSVTASWPSVFMFFVFPRNVSSTGFQLWTITSLTSSWNSSGAKPPWSTKPKQPTSQQWSLTFVFPSYFLRTHSLIILELPIPHSPFFSCFYFLSFPVFISFMLECITPIASRRLSFSLLPSYSGTTPVQNYRK